MNKILFTALFGALSFALGAQNEILGVWLNEEEDGKIKVYKEGERYHGKIVWIEDKADDNDQIRTDRENPDPDLRDRPLVGLEVLRDLEWDSDDQEWDDGTIYDPKSGNTYDVFARLEDPNTLYLKGYIGFSLIGRSTLWKRVE